MPDRKSSSGECTGHEFIQYKTIEVCAFCLGTQPLGPPRTPSLLEGTSSFKLEYFKEQLVRPVSLSRYGYRRRPLD